ncbi:MAG: SpoIIE family protein phosphatase [Kiritimatiellaeota bacterium]|nr:SpoIIE family protein phosphatase [Kiritimatiellota bacterium]
MRPGEQRRLAILSAPENVRSLAAFCDEAVSDVFDEGVSASIELAVVEAVNNIVEHSYSSQKDGPIELTIEHTGVSVVFTFLDNGVPFEAASIQTPSFDWKKIDDAPEDGWGLFLMSSIMDDLQRKRSGGVNILRMTKKCVDASEGAVESRLKRVDDSKGIVELQSTLDEAETALDEMAEELSSAYESLNLFYSLSKDVALISDLDAFLANTLKKSLAVSGAEWGAVRLKDGDNLVLRASTIGCPEVVLAPAVNLNDEKSLEVQVTESLTREVRDSYSGEKIRVLCVPIVGLDEFLGTILLGKSGLGEQFTSGDGKLARAMSDQIAVSIENNRLYSKAMSAELAEREMQIAKNLQQKLILKKLPVVPELDFYIRCEPAKQVGGDYLTLHKTNDDFVYLILSDAMGKGMSASFFSLLSHMAFHSIILGADDGNLSPAEILKRANRIMASDFDLFGMFMTAFVGKVDLRKGALSYASAGHCPPILQKKDGPPELLDVVDYMMGVEVDTEYENLTAEFPPGAKLLVYSDGLTDITDAEGEMLGVEPLLNICDREFRGKNIKEACDLILREIKAAAGSPFQDDISMIGVERSCL